MFKAILLFISILFISCSNNNEKSEIDESIYTNNTLEDYELFEKANKFINDNLFDQALLELDKLEVIYPASIYTNKGRLVSAYIYFLKKDYEKTRAVTENYKKYYPGSSDIVYANYLEAMTYYVLIKKPNYSQKDSLLALEKFNFILNAYPNSKYEIDVITKINVINNNISNNNLLTAKFYLEKNNYNAALIYLKENFEAYNSSFSIEETLFYLVKIYYSLNEEEVAKQYAAILAYNFPNGIWYKKSYDIINKITNIQKDETWFKKFNPIKIFIKDKKIEENELLEI